MNPKTLRRVSASRLNNLMTCTMQFYMSEILGLPQKTWSRTHAGSCAHGVLECLYRLKHRKHHDVIKETGTVYSSPAVARLIRAWQWKTKMSDEIVADIDAMCMVAINHTDFLDEDAIERFEPEHEFKLVLSNGAVVKGFIDKLKKTKDGWVISDFKTARNKHTKKDVRDSFQSLVYQLYLYKTYGVLAEVRYYFLRHAPTKLHPKKHMMVTPPPTVAQLQGFEMYLEHMWVVINNFGMKEATSGYCADKSFCDRVCSYRYPAEYIALKKKETNELVGTFMIDNPPQVPDDCYVETLYHKGCMKWNPQ